MAANDKHSSHADQEQQKKNAQSQGERGGYGNTTRDAGGSQHSGQGQSHSQGQQGMGGSQQGNKDSSKMNGEDDEM